ncbi:MULTISPECIES: hypothetical protein [Caproicibacterium]|uniref:Uncharacterized protein n=1 Tax=Caproicibacterium lactatifermentans TaxID=2666138 RepID=A0ABX6PY57_9FIRM|nr:hypothetical protein [Caproicibacterium lactatifermentans]QKO30771.1 hypothetical protein GKP14_07030 [Caproicibacterium lactatifermentans]
MPAAIVQYLFAEREEAALEACGLPVPDENSFLWGAQGTAVLSGESNLQDCAKALRSLPPERRRALLCQYAGQHSEDTAVSCVYGFLCGTELESAASPFVRWAAVQLSGTDSSQPTEVWEKEEESALDTILLRYERGMLPTEFPLVRTLPKSETACRQTAHLCAFLLESLTGHADGQDLCEAAAAECRRRYRKMTDRTGLKRIFFQHKEGRGPHEKSSCLHSFMEDGGFDYANLQGADWGTPACPDRRTFLQLYGDTVTQVQKTICACVPS